MSTDPELLRVEESVKDRFLDLVRNFSHQELKKFKKSEYAEMIFQDMSKLLPGFDKKQLRETAHYVSNAVNSEASRELSKRSTNIASTKENNTALLSLTVLDDFENTMQACDETTEDGSSGDISFEFESQTQLNDSATQLKQTIQSENATSVNNKKPI